MSRGIRIMAALSVSVALAACAKTELYTDLSEREANLMASVLKSAGLDAEKSTKDGKVWTLTASKAEFGHAVALLEARGLPRARFENLGEIFKKEGFISSPVEEHARLMYGLSQELSNTISTMDGVLVARVHIVVPDPDPLADSQKPSSASVFIKFDPQVDVSSQIGSIKSLLANSVEGLPYERVSVVLSPARPSAIAPPTPASSPGILTLWPAAALASGMAAVVAWRLNRLRGGRL
jgi:type III secretion protein J